ncbi:MAG: hypothetical protein C4326_10280 [Ignavibacteria bacterium]
MRSVSAHIAVVLLASCYGLVSLAEPIEHLARVIVPGGKPQQVTAAKSTKPITGASYVLARRHLPLTKQIELPPHVVQTIVIESPLVFQTYGIVRWIEGGEVQCIPPPLRSRPPPPA